MHIQRFVLLLLVTGCHSATAPGMLRTKLLRLGCEFPIHVDPIGDNLFVYRQTGCSRYDMPVAWCGRPASLPVGYAAISDDPVDRNAAASLREGAAAYWPRQLCPAAEAVIFGPPFVYLYTPPDQPLNATPERFFAMWLECLGTGTSPAFFQRDGWSIFRDPDGTWSAVNTALFSSRPGIGSI